MLYHTLCNITLYHIVLCYTILYYITLYYDRPPAGPAGHLGPGKGRHARREGGQQLMNIYIYIYHMYKACYFKEITITCIIHIHKYMIYIYIYNVQYDNLQS